jgi:hypothetical protein
MDNFGFSMLNEVYLAPLLFTGKLGLISLVPSFTSPKSLLRFALVPILAYSTWIELLSWDIFTASKIWQGVLAGYSAWWLIHFIDVALLSRWSFEAGGPTSRGEQKKKGENAEPKDGRGGIFREGDDGGRTSGQQESLWARLKFGAWVASSFRFPNTAFQLKNIPPFRSGNEAFVPSRTQFIVHNILSVTFSYIVLDFLSHGDFGHSSHVELSKISIFWRLGDLSRQELGARFGVTLSCWAGLYFLQRGVYDSLALVCVGSGLSSPSEWPPLFGSPVTASSMGKFWGSIRFSLFSGYWESNADHCRVFWHQLHARKLSSMSSFLVSVLTRSQRRNAMTMLLSLAMTFLLSGMVHFMVDLGVGILGSESGAVQFFLLQAFAIWFDETAKEIYKAIVSRSLRFNLLEKLVGYAWVVAFLT